MEHFLLFADEDTYRFWQKNGAARVIAENAASDLNLDQIAAAIKKLTPDYPQEFFLYPCFHPATVKLRTQIMSALSADSCGLEKLKAFQTDLLVLSKMRQTAFSAVNSDQRNAYFISAVRHYCKCAETLREVTAAFADTALSSLYTYVTAITTTDSFHFLLEESESLYQEIRCLSSLSLQFDFTHKTVRAEPPEESGLASQIEAAAEQILGLKLDLTYSVVNSNPITAVEENLIGILKMRKPELFSALDAFYEKNKTLDFYAILDLREQLLYYTGYLDFVRKYKDKGFSFVFAEENDEGFVAKGLYDLSLAVRLGDANAVISNDLSLRTGEIFVLSGANQGGKTTFLRAVGQCITLAAAGYPVPAGKCGLWDCDCLITHFNRPETQEKSRLEDEIDRTKAVLPYLTQRSVILFNECFVGTRRKDAVILSHKLFEKIFSCGVTCGFVTHYFELSLEDPRLISLVAQISDDGLEKRTYHILRCPPDGLAHARSIAEQCGATYEDLMKLIGKSDEACGRNPLKK